MKKLFVLFLLSFLTVSVFAKNRIVVSKTDFTLTVLSEKNDTLYHCSIAYGKNQEQRLR